jgi:hypothetical protein
MEPFEHSNGWRGGCAARIHIEVANVTSAGVVVERAWADGVGTGGLSTDGLTQAVALAPGEVWRGTLMAHNADHYRVSLQVRYPSSQMTAMNSPMAELNIINPMRAAAMAACRRCRGRWGPDGLAAIDRCVCPMPDAGRRCLAARQCRGDCLFDHFERVGAPDSVRPVGRCAPDDDIFGCRTPIPDNAAVAPRSEQSLSTNCAD